MHFFSGLSALTVVGSLLALVQATGLEACPRNVLCCPNRPRFLFRRTSNQCSTTECCKKYESSVGLHSSTTLQCGRKGEKTSTVTVKVEKCPTTDEKCLRVYYANVPGTSYKEVHLEIARTINKSAPGRFDFNHYCTTSGNSANCWVPLSVVVKKLFGSDYEKDLCDKSVLIAAHAAISDGNTCWGVGPKIDQKSNNWAMNFKVTFECSNECVEKCYYRLST